MSESQPFNLSPRRWSKREEWWLGSVFHQVMVRGRVSRFLMACPEPFRGEVLEVGAGRGWTSRRILETYPQVELTATDIDQKAMENFQKMRQQYGRRLYVKEADVMELPFDRSSFDFVAADHVLHYVDDYAKALQQLLRVLRPGGLLGVIGSEWIGKNGIFKLMWPSVRRIRIADLERVFMEEKCDVLAKQKDINSYCIWVRKAYPVKSN